MSLSTPPFSTRAIGALYQIVYVSSAVQRFSSDALRDLLARSRENNQRAGVTGMLLYHDGNFMQALEGPEPEVERVFARIEQDPRHRGTIVLIRQPVMERSFSEWAMAFREVAAGTMPPADGFSGFMRGGSARHRAAVSRAWDLLTSFRDSAR